MNDIPPIKFSHSEYDKFFYGFFDDKTGNTIKEIKNGDEVTLLGVAFFQNLAAIREALGEKFVEWDTRYFENHEEKHYPLKEGVPYLVLTFAKPTQQGLFFFTTIRSATSRFDDDVSAEASKKRQFYDSHVGKQFEVEISEAKL